MRKFGMILLIIVLQLSGLKGKILFRSTFETWEGTLSETGWIISYSGIGEVLKDIEDPNDPIYQKQEHGEYSLKFSDPDDTSYAYAKREFPAFGMIPNHPEYMVEFYFWFPGSGVEIENLYLYKPTKSSNPADIEIVLDSTALNSVSKIAVISDFKNV